MEATRSDKTRVKTDRERRELLAAICLQLDLKEEEWSCCALHIAELVKDLREARDLLVRSRTGLENMLDQEVFAFCAHEEQSRQEIKRIDEYLQRCHSGN